MERLALPIGYPEPDTLAWLLYSYYDLPFCYAAKAAETLRILTFSKKMRGLTLPALYQLESDARELIRTLNTAREAGGTTDCLYELTVGEWGERLVERGDEHLFHGLAVCPETVLILRDTSASIGVEEQFNTIIFCRGESSSREAWMCIETPSICALPVELCEAERRLALNKQNLFVHADS